MGQAKRRGSYEARAAQAEARIRAEGAAGAARNMVGMTDAEVYEWAEGREARAAGCLLLVAVAVIGAVWAVCAYCQRREDETIAAYSICEMCGALLDATNVHARCSGEVASYAR